MTTDYNTRPLGYHGLVSALCAVGVWSGSDVDEICCTRHDRYPCDYRLHSLPIGHV